MSITTTPTVPPAYMPGALSPATRGRHIALTRRLFDMEVEERRPVRDGYAFRFPGHSLSALARFVENERKCCPSFRFELTVLPGPGPIWLTISGPVGARRIIEAELLPPA